MDPLDFTKDPEELRKEARAWRDRYWQLMSKVDKSKIANDLWEKMEDGSQNRFDTIFKKHYLWWLVHNLIAHVWIGFWPSKKSFDFHDYTSRKMRQ